MAVYSLGPRLQISIIKTELCVFPLFDFVRPLLKAMQEFEKIRAIINLYEVSVCHRE